MPTNVLLAPVGAGKTEVALERLVRVVSDRPFARVWALLATKRQEDAFRQRLAGWDGGRRAYFNVEFFNFYDLYNRLLDIAGQPPRRLNDAARFGLLRAIAAQLQSRGQLEIYGSVARTPGFIRVVAEFIYELKQNRVYPGDFARAARSAQDRELERIYSAYQDRLIEHKLVDREGEGWLALEVLARNEHIARDVDLLLVDGYDQFTPVQADLLALLAGRAADTLITLTTVPGREDTAGRRFREALERLEARCRPAHSLVVQSPPALRDSRHPDLQHLTAEIFLDRPPRAASGGVILIEAPEPAQEVGAALRRVKRLLLAEGARPDDILIAIRDWRLYRAHLAALGRAYGLPLALHYGEPLAENPAIAALLDLLELPAADFRRRDLLDALRSPYFDAPGLGSEQVDLLERIGQAYRVTGGREGWLEAIRRAASGWGGDAALDADDESTFPAVEPAEAEQLAGALAAFFDAITPPPEASVRDYVRWLETLIGPDAAQDPDEAETASEEGGGLRLLWQLRRPAAEDHLVARDLAALLELKDVLWGLLSAQALFATLGEGSPMTWEAFLANLRAAINNAAVDAGPSRTGRVLVTTAADARGLPHDHVFILGLSEGIFPALLPEDALYLDSERLRLRAAGVFLETQAERAADDGLFYELISLARKSLTLSRPTVQDGRLWLASHLWRGVTAAFTGLEVNRLGVGEVVGADEAASLDEAALALADSLNRAPGELTEDAKALYGWMGRQPYWQRIRLGRAVEMERLSQRPYNRYSGRLSDERLIAWIAALLGPDYVWSASQFNEFGSCGFRFFARRLLNLEALEEPEGGLDVRRRGTLNHEILEQTYRRLAQMGATLTAQHVERALEVLREAAAEVLRDAPRKLGFRANALWEQEKGVLLRKLEALVRLDLSEDSPVLKKFGHEVRRPYRLEAPFGMGGGPPLLIDLGDDLPPLRVRGMIDRMDRAGDGVIVVDYKSGSAAIPVSEMAAGRNFQMMVYLLAAAAILRANRAPGEPRRVIGGLFWHLRNQQVSGEARPEDEALERARERLADYIARGRRGDFAVHPNRPANGRCAPYCEYHQLCRVGSTNRYKRGG